jgi:hypothetical protein
MRSGPVGRLFDEAAWDFAEFCGEIRIASLNSGDKLGRDGDGGGLRGGRTYLGAVARRKVSCGKRHEVGKRGAAATRNNCDGNALGELAEEGCDGGRQAGLGRISDDRGESAVVVEKEAEAAPAEKRREVVPGGENVRK